MIKNNVPCAFVSDDVAHRLQQSGLIRSYRDDRAFR